MNRSLPLLAAAALALACGDSTKIPLGSLDGAASPPVDAPRSADTGGPPPVFPGPIGPGPVVPDASTMLLDATAVIPPVPAPGPVPGPSPGPVPPPIPGPVFPDAGATPPPIEGDNGCGVTSLCWSLRSAYARVIEGARSCDPSVANACSVKVVDSLGCSKCETWVNDAGTLNMLRDRFQQAGCDRCFFTARTDTGGTPRPATRCPDIACPQVGAPKCTLPSGIGPAVVTRGYCDSATLPVCPAGLMNGSACSSASQYCFGGGFGACQCKPTEPPTWYCF
jgi:hypothetical protein